MASSTDANQQTLKTIHEKLIQACYSGDVEHAKALYLELETAMVGVASETFVMKVRMRDAAIAAATAGHAALLDFFLSTEGPAVEICGGLSTSAASGSKAQAGSIETFQVLLDYGWGPDLEEPGYGSALTVSLKHSNLSAIQFLLSHGASPSRSLKQFRGKSPARERWGLPLGTTPLDFAAAHCSPEIVDLLLSYSADVSACNALHHAATAQWRGEEEYQAMIRHLIAKGMDVNRIEGSGNKEQTKKWGAGRPLGTALHYAARGVYPERVRFLLEIGADKNTKATNGLTALEWIEGNEDLWDEEIGELLKREGN